MKRLNNLVAPLFLFLLCTILMSAKCEYDYQETSYSPVLIDRNELEQPLIVKKDPKIENPGKIYTIENYIFIVDQFRGVHIFNNTDNENPKHEALLIIPGCSDVAVKDQTLYADNAIDMIAIDLSNKDSMEIVYRIAEIFPEIPPPDLNYIPNKYSKNQRISNTVIIDWKLK